MTFLYNFVLIFFFIVALICNLRKIKSRGWFFVKSKLGFGLARLKFSEKKRVWIHAVSLGEVKAAHTLVLKYQSLGDQVFISTATDTGFKKAQSYIGVEVFYLPLDFSFVMKRTTRKIKPDLVIVVESDVWPQMLVHAKNKGAQIHFVSAKISTRSFNRLKRVKPIAKWLFKYFDRVFVQNELYMSRFLELGVCPSKLSIQKNLKFDALGRKPNFEKVVLNRRQGVIMLSCTHLGEERLLLEKIKDLIGSYTLILAPRHLERCKSISNMLKAWGVEKSSQTNVFREKCILIDQIGVLDSFYDQADVIVMGASFIDGLGGHNILEPLLHKKKILFGPYMENQMDLVEHVKGCANCDQIELDQVGEKISKVFAQKC